MITADKVHRIIDKTDGVKVIKTFTPDVNGGLWGKIELETKGKEEHLEWEVLIAPTYPFRTLNTEPITFRNILLLDYPHIMEEGNLCMHPAIYEKAEEQFAHDLAQLKEWVERYYVNREKDEHYDHLVVNHSPIREAYFTYCFTDTKTEMTCGDYGEVAYIKLLDGINVDKKVNNFVVREFTSHSQVKKQKYECELSKFFTSAEIYSGVYCLLYKAPAVHNKFIIKGYKELEPLLSQKQLDFIHTFAKTRKEKAGFFPLFIGYKIPDGYVHWQASILFLDNLPIEPFWLGAGRLRVWHTQFKTAKIDWAQTENISYRYFFGRGSMNVDLAEKNTLVLGVGAIGSIVAETLTRCGVKHLTLYDFDIKEPGNICRSGYSFTAGITEKTAELYGILCRISPQLECDILRKEVDVALKGYAANVDDKTIIRDLFQDYDIIFDCTTDNQLMQVLDSVDLKPRIVNLSITNHAEDLVCAFSPNITETVRLMYSILDRNPDMDLYNPTGCWNPTFKASYNDISCKVQFAMKHIMSMLSGKEPLGNFFITDDEINMKIQMV